MTLRLANADDTPGDLFSELRRFTPARIGIGRAGDSLPTARLIEFQAAHALARDAVHGEVDWPAIRAALPGPDIIEVHSKAVDRSTYLRRPDLGRMLREDDTARLPHGMWDLALVIADGLSSAAVMSWAAPTATAIMQQLPDWRIAPIICARQARVAIADEIGQHMGVPLVAVLIGERPGLSVANSLSIYLTYEPRIGRKDSERNCISNIHAAGLSPTEAAQKLCWLSRMARAHRLSGIGLKDEAPSLAAAQKLSGQELE